MKAPSLPASLRLANDSDNRRARVADPSASVLIATVARPIGDTGVQVHTRMLRDGFVSAGIPCQIVSPFHAPAYWGPIFAAKVAIKRMSPTWGTRWYRRHHLAALRQALKTQIFLTQPALIIAQCPLAAAAALELRDLLNANYKIALVCHFNYSEATEYRDKGELQSPSAFDAILNFEKSVFTKVDHVIHVSEFSRQAVEVHRAITPRQSTIIYNGIATKSPKSLSRDSLNWHDDDLILINVGTLEKRKNQIGLIELFSLIAPRFPKAILALVGDGPSRPEIKHKIEQLNLANRVQLLGMRRDVPSLLPAADLYVHYATLENCPISLLEAARAALPIAALPTGGIPELLRKLHCGVELNAANLQASLENVSPLLENPALRAQLSRSAHENFQKFFTTQAMTDQYLHALDLLTPSQELS